MANRNQDYSNQAGSRRQQSQDWRNEDRDYGEDEGQSSVRSGSYDEGRTQYGRDRDRDRDRDRERYGRPDDQSGSTGRYAGYGYPGQGEFARGDNQRSGWSGQRGYGQSGYGQS